jgi:hypothetical protein
MNMFRTLRADEIDCRIAQIKENGLSLLLYKDARCDQNILDEVVGPFNWKREHTRDNRNCIVSIKNPETGEWVSKEDTGTESNTEKEKGLASDSFKRACFNWGIGRELYTAPFIWIPAEKCNIKENRGRPACYDRFTVKGIGYTDGVITGVEIKNQATGKICFKWGEINEEAPDKPEQPDDEPPEVKPITQDAPGEVKTADKLPKKAQTLSPVMNYIRNEIADIQEQCGIESFESAKKQVDDFAKALADGGAIPKFKWNAVSMEEAKAIFSAIRANMPEGEPA